MIFLMIRSLCIVFVFSSFLSVRKDTNTRMTEKGFNRMAATTLINIFFCDASSLLIVFAFFHPYNFNIYIYGVDAILSNNLTKENLHPSLTRVAFSMPPNSGNISAATFFHLPNKIIFELFSYICVCIIIYWFEIIK